MKPVVYTISQYYETPRASRQKYLADEHPLRVRGTPEYNPLYDAFQSDPVVGQRQTYSDFRPITPPPPRFVRQFDDTESAYDKPRSFALDREPAPRTNRQRQQSPRGQKKVGEN